MLKNNVFLLGVCVLLTGTARGQLANELTYTPITPCRVLDTRTAGSGGTLLQDTERLIPVPSLGCPIPSTARAYAANVTVVPRADLTPAPVDAITLWPAGYSRPSTPAIRNPAGRVLANHLVIPADTTGRILAHSTDQTELIIDINGYWTEAADGLVFFPIPPCRVVDTRQTPGVPSPWYDPPIELGLGAPALTAVATRTFNISSSTRCGTLPPNAGAFAVNLTVVPTGSLSYISVWPRPIHSPTSQI